MLLWIVSLLPSANAEALGTLTNSPASQIVEFAGKVEVATAPDAWVPARAGMLLVPGNQLRTAANSRASLQLGDRSVIRIDQNTLVEIRPPTGGLTSSARSFFLRFGALFFLNRERPTEVEFQTPLSTGAIRGTEFLLTCDPKDASTRLALFDGAVRLTALDQTLDLAPGEQAEVAPGQPPRRTPALPADALIQWVFYYPAILDPADLNFSQDETARLAPSVAAYKEGSLTRALQLLQDSDTRLSPSITVYRAALELSLGQLAAVDVLPTPPDFPAVSALTDALRELVTAVRGLPFPPASDAAPTTTSGWLARSYRRQLELRLPEALEAARQATVSNPGFGFAWARLAELEFSLGHRHDARVARDRSLRLAPFHAPALALGGFIDLDENHPERALQEFQRAAAVDGALPTAWLGQGLALGALRRFDDARRHLQIAAALEPRRGVFRAYLAKAFSEIHEDSLAEKDFWLARELDPADPTAWFLSALHQHQLNHLNAAVRDLEKAVELNDNQAVFRSSLLLDQDRALRGADLAALYHDVGLSEVAYRSATRAIADDYGSFASHLFLARQLQEREDPARIDLRYETPRQSELLVANLLAPPGAGNLSQLLSQQDHLHYFGPRPIAVSSLTEYRDNGSWLQNGSVFGQSGNLGYALDSQFFSSPGSRPNADLESLHLSLQAQEHITPSDSVYLQVGWSDGESGDVARHADPASASATQRVTSRQEPHLYLGYHHEWSPANHTLFLAGHLQDRLHLRNDDTAALFLIQRNGATADASTVPGYRLSLDSAFTLNSIEAQHIFGSEHHSVVAGARFQDGSVENESVLRPRFPAPSVPSAIDSSLQRADVYSYYHWKPIDRLILTAGLGYHDLDYPANADLPPLSAARDHASLLAPAAAVMIQPWKGADLRAAYTRSLGGLYFDESIRLEPTQVAGFIQSFRSLIPESVAGLVPGTSFDSIGSRFDQALPGGTFLGIEALQLTSNGERDVGALSNSLAVPLPDSPTQTRQTLDFQERSVALYLNQLLGDSWSLGARYRLSVAQLDGRFPSLPSQAPGVAGLLQDECSTLGVLELAARFHASNGIFAEWHSEFFHQDSDGYTPELADPSLWQHHVFVGYRWPRRRAEVRVGLLNLTDEEPRLNPLNLTIEPPRERTLFLSLRLNF